MKRIIFLPAIFLLILLSAVVIQREPEEILLWPNGAPGSEGKTDPEKTRFSDEGDIVLSSIHKPSITPYIPSAEKSTGAAVIVAPGGGHSELWISHEGYAPAHWLMEHGVAAFVLKYRLAREKNSTYSVDNEELADMQRAIRLVRNRAKEWNIDTAKIGVIGFSAGGELAGLAAMKFTPVDQNAVDVIDKESDRPDFQGLIYPGNLSRFDITKASPPAFIAGGFHDRADISEGIARVYLKFKEVGVPAELHIYASAGHGFGIRQTNKGASSQWPEAFYFWLADMKFLSIAPEKK